MTLTLTVFLTQLLLLSQCHGRPRRTLTAANDGSPNAVECHNGSQLAAAFANSSIQVAYIMRDIAMVDMDWAEYNVPLARWQNLTVAGFNSSSDDWPVLDLGFVSDKVVLAPGVVLELTHLGLRGWRQRPYFQAPAIDLLADGRGLIAQLYGSNDVSAVLTGRDSSVRQAVVLMRDMAFIQRTCLPLSITYTSVKSLPRPPYLPGNQSSARMPLATDCLNTTTITGPLLRRCWPATGRYRDLVTYAMMYDTSNQPVQAGYLLWWVNVNYLCETLMSELCACLHSALGCYYRMFPPPGITPVPPEEPAENSPKHCANLTTPAKLGASDGSGGQGQVGSDSGGSSDSLGLLAPLLGGLLGGVVAAIGLLLIVWHLHSRRRRKAPSHTQKSPQRPDLLTKSCTPEVVVAAIETLGPSHTPSSEAGSFSAGLLPYMPSSFHDTSSDILVTPSTQHRHGLVLNVRITAAGQKVTAESTSREPSFLAACGSSATGSATVPPSADDTVALLPESLGRGAFGSVYVGVYRGTRVAVKVISLDGQGLSRNVAGTSPQSAREDPEQRQEQHQEQQQQQQGQSDERKPHHTQQTPSDEVLAAGDHHTPACGSAVGQAARMVLQLPRPVSAEEGAQVTGCRGTEREEQGAGLTEPQAVTGRQGAAGGTQTASGDGLVKMGSGNNSNSGGGGKGSRHGGGVSSSGRSGVARWSRSSSPVQHSGAARWTNGDDGSSFAFQGVPTIFEEQVKMEELQPRPVERYVEQQATKQAEMLVQEVEVLGRCTHPNVVQLLAACVTPPRFCLVLELMETSLQHLIYSRPGVLLPLPTVLHIAAQVCQGLAYLHPTIVHRDLKPPNVLLSGTDGPWPVAKLADFGLSRIRFETVPTLKPQAGTPAYIAPECLDTANNLVTHRADIYSLGVLLWSMLTGQEPWKGVQLLVLACKVASGKRPPLEALSEDRCPPRLRRLIAWCWEQDPQRRPAAAEALVEVQQILLELQVEENGMVHPEKIGDSRSASSCMQIVPGTKQQPSGNSIHEVCKHADDR